MKTCKTCNIEKPLDQFATWRRKDKSIALQPHCKVCIRDKQRAYRAANREHVKEVDKAFRASYRKTEKGNLSYRRTAWKRYGIDPELAELYYLAHDGKCEICKEPGDSLCVDHCHDTKIIRGMLCQKCNTALGLLNDDANRLQTAYNYLIQKGYK